MALSDHSPWKDSIPIARLQPGHEPESRSVKGIVTLIWPYSTSRETFSLLLVESDFRLRRQKGQVRVHFTGSSAKSLAKSGIESGDSILLSLNGVVWTRDVLAEKTPGRGIEWLLQFQERLVLQIQRDSQAPILLDIDHPEASPRSQTSLPTALHWPQSPDPVVSKHSALQSNKDPQIWTAPAFLKRKVAPSPSFSSRPYNLFGYGDAHGEVSPSKRTKFGRKSGEWKFADQPASPITETEAVDDEDNGNLTENEVQETAVPMPPEAYPQPQGDENTVVDPRSMGAAVPFEDAIAAGPEKFETYEEAEGQSAEHVAQIRKFHGLAPRTQSPPALSASPETNEPRRLIQDTYEPDTWSTPSTAADPSMEVATNILHREKHNATDALSFSAPVLLDSSQSRTQGSSKSGSIGELAYDVMSEGSDPDSKSVENEQSDEGPFSKRAYTPSEGESSPDTDSEDLEGIDATSDGLEDQNERNGPIEDTQERSLRPTFTTISSCYGFDHGYDGSAFSRPQKLSEPSSASGYEPGSQSTTDTELMREIHQSVSADDLQHGDRPERSRDEATIPGPIQDDALDQTESYDAQLRPVSDAQQSKAQMPEESPTIDPHEGEPEIGQRASAGDNVEFPVSNDLDYKYPRRTYENGTVRYLSEFGDILSDDEISLQAKVGVQPQVEARSSKDNNESPATADGAFAQRSELAPTVDEKLVKSIGGSYPEWYREKPDRQSSVAHSRDASDLKLVEIADVDKYEVAGLKLEVDDLVRSGNVDYWRDERLRTEDSIDAGFEGDEELQSEGEIVIGLEDGKEPQSPFETGPGYEDDEGLQSSYEIVDGFDEEYEDELSDGEDFSSADQGEVKEEMIEDDMTWSEESAPVDNLIQKTGEDNISRPGTKTTRVEIIDLESDDEDEPVTTSVDRLDAPQVLSMVPGMGRISGEISATAMHQQEIDETTHVTQGNQAQQQEARVDHDVPEQIQLLVESPTKSRREVQDTYAEDASLSDQGVSVTFSALDEDFKPSSTHLLTDFLPASAVVAEESAASSKLSIVSTERSISDTTAQGLLSMGNTDFHGRSSPPDEEMTICESKDLMKQTAKVDATSPAHEEFQAKISSHRGEKTDASAFTHGQTFAVQASGENPTVGTGEEAFGPYDDENSQGVAEESSMQDPRVEIAQRSQLLTPNDTQTTTIIHEPSDLPDISQDKQNALPTPSMTQRTSDLLPLTPPALPRKPSLIEKLREMRSTSAKKRQANVIDPVRTVMSPWFGTSRSSHVAPSSDQESIAGVEEETGRDGDVSSEAESSEVNAGPSLPTRHAVSPALESVFARLPSSSPPPCPKPKPGFRTSLSYFAPLSTLRSHYNTTTSVLALALTSTSISRATAGPKDYHMTMYITDPSSSSPPSVTSARIFRPSKLPFPEAKLGDAILLRNFRVVSYRKQLGLLSTDSSAWAVFRRGEEPQIKGPPVEFGAEERGFARGLWDWWSSVEREAYADAIPEESPERKGRHIKGKHSRSSVVRHELRDGTTYIDRPKVKNNEMHQLRDGTVWSDSKL